MRELIVGWGWSAGVSEPGQGVPTVSLMAVSEEVARWAGRAEGR